MKVLRSKVELHYSGEFSDKTAIIQERLLPYKHDPSSGMYVFEIEQIAMAKDGQPAKRLEGYSKSYQASMVKAMVAGMGYPTDPRTDFVNITTDILFKFQLGAMMLKPRFGSTASDWELVDLNPPVIEDEEPIVDPI